MNFSETKNNKPSYDYSVSEVGKENIIIKIAGIGSFCISEFIRKGGVFGINPVMLIISFK